MLDLNITLVFQLINFFIALFFLNWLLIKPIREIIKKRNGIMDDMASGAVFLGSSVMWAITVRMDVPYGRVPSVDTCLLASAY